MIQKDKIKIMVCLLGTIIWTDYALGSQPVFDVTPTTPNYFALSPLRTVPVSYNVVNNTSSPYQLVLKSLPGLSVANAAGGDGNCSYPFILSSSESCTLNLIVNGSQISSAASSVGGPVICKTVSSTDLTPTPFLCSQPSFNNQLNINPVRGFIYFANRNVQCSTYPMAVCDTTASGYPTNCVNSNVPIGAICASEGMVFNPTRTQAFIGNNSGSIAGSITRCDVNNNDGTLSNCVDSGATGISNSANPQNILINPNNTYVYLTLNSTKAVYYCPINIAAGTIGECIDSGYAFTDNILSGTFGSTGKFLYVGSTNSSNNSGEVQKCLVDQTTGGLSTCTTLLGIGNVVQPIVGFNSSYTIAYILDINNSSYTMCNVDSQGDFFDCNEHPLSIPGFSQPGSLVFNAAGNLVYMRDNNASYQQIAICNIDLTTNQFVNCTAISTAPYSPLGIVLG